MIRFSRPSACVLHLLPSDTSFCIPTSMHRLLVSSICSISDHDHRTVKQQTSLTSSLLYTLPNVSLFSSLVSVFSSLVFFLFLTFKSHRSDTLDLIYIHESCRAYRRQRRPLVLFLDLFLLPPCPWIYNACIPFSRSTSFFGRSLIIYVDGVSYDRYLSMHQICTHTYNTHYALVRVRAVTHD
jgi:hypothetical protein